MAADRGTLDVNEPTTRRSLLAGLIGAVAASVVAAAGRPSPVRAGSDGDVILGVTNPASTKTEITNATTDADVFAASTIRGGIAIHGTSANGVAIQGDCPSGTGVFGSSQLFSGVYGTSSSGDTSAIIGDSAGFTGVQGTSGGYHAARPKTGVYGFAAQDGTSRGVVGESVTGLGVVGISFSSVGVTGTSYSGIAIQGTSDKNIAIHGVSHGSIGVRGTSDAANQPAVLGKSNGGSTGVQGVSGAAGLMPAGKPKTGVYGFAAQDTSSRGVIGETTVGIGVQGVATSGYAGYFVGKVYTTAWYELSEITSPPAPAANRARLFVRDSGAGKTQLCVRFASGAIKVLATEP